MGCPGLERLAKGRRAAVAPSGERGDDKSRDAAEQRERNEPHRRGHEQDTQGEPEHIEPERGQCAEQPDVLPEKPMHAGSTLYAHPGSLQGLGRDSETAGDLGQPYDHSMVELHAIRQGPGVRAGPRALEALQRLRGFMTPHALNSTRSARTCAP